MFNLPVQSGLMTAFANLPTAVLIDGENMSASIFPSLRTHLNSIPGIGITRVYGDFSNAAHAKWLEICRREGLEAVLHCSQVSGKNGADILITIAAMDILATGKFRRIVLVSSDSDFLALVRRLRAGGMEVIGIGHTMQSSAVSATWSKWMNMADPSAKPVSKPAPPAKLAQVPQPPAAFCRTMQEIIGDNAMLLSAVGEALRQSAPELVAALGKGKLKKHIQAVGIFELNGDLVRRRAA